MPSIALKLTKGLDRCSDVIQLCWYKLIYLITVIGVSPEQFYGISLLLLFLLVSFSKL